MKAAIPQNLHTHTAYSDGENSPREFVEAALAKGFVSLGFSEHAYAPYDAECCITEEDTPLYKAELARLREEYRGRIRLFCGLEADCLHPAGREGLDYTIGSFHYLRGEDGGMYPVDDTPERFEEAVRQVGGGSVRVLVERYYAQVARMARTQRHDIIGHLDLITKFNRGNGYFDPREDWYLRAAAAAVEAIAERPAVVEVNTGGNFRGYTDGFYPSGALLNMLRDRHIPVTVSSDAHSVLGLDHGFGRAAEMLRQAGYESVRLLGPDGFYDWKL